MSQVARHASDLDRVPEVRDADTLSRFFVEFDQSTLDGRDYCTRHLKATAKKLFGKENAKAFAKNVKNFHADVWEKPLFHKVSTVPLEEVVIVCIDPSKGDMVDVTSQVGLALFTLTQKSESNGKSLSPKRLASMRKLIKSRGKDDEEICSALLNMFSNSSDVLSLFNHAGMIRWKIDDERIVRNLLAPGLYDPLFRLLGLVVAHYGRSSVTGANRMLTNYEATVLYTEEEITQDRHRDYREAELRGRGVSLGGPQPWSADIPLVKGGLFLNIWHGYDQSRGRDFSGNQNICIHVPLGYVTVHRMIIFNIICNCPNHLLRIFWMQVCHNVAW
jgi:hypothetical protein